MHAIQKQQHKKYTVTLALLALAVIVVAVGCLFVGSSSMTFREGLSALFGKGGRAHSRIIWNIRIPRVLTEALEKLGEEDLVMITADHGCDPAYAATTDHTREYVPLLVLGKRVKPVNLGTRASFADIAATVADYLGIPLDTPGTSFADQILR